MTLIEEAQEEANKASLSLLTGDTDFAISHYFKAIKKLQQHTKEKEGIERYQRHS